MFVEVPRSSKGSAYLRVGFRCNQDCGFCWQDRTWPDAPDEVIFTWLDELAERGIRRLAISGGEPTLFRRLPELIERAHRKHKMLVMLQTNAIRLGKEAYTASLVRAGLKELFVSFHSPDAKESDLMTRAPCTHERTVSGIEASLRAGLKVGLNCVVERSNYRSLPSHAQFIIDRFVRPFAKAAVFVEYSHPSASHDVARYEAMTATCEEVAPFLRDALRLLNDSGVAAKAFGSCGFPPCMMQDSAELIQWVDTASVSGRPGRMYAAACDACAAKRYCLGLRNEYVALHGTSVARPFANPPRRRRR
jgi:MoaA/NifB/PqqE/SkfB family radical SAM enzyme